MAKILYITEIYPDPAHGIGVWGGGEKQFYEISRRIAELGNEVTVLTCRFPGQESEEIMNGLRIIRAGTSRELRAGGASKSVWPLTYALKTGLKALRAKSDLIHCNTYFPIYAGEIASLFPGTPIVATFHDVYGVRGWIASQGSVFWGTLGHLVTTFSAKMPLDRVIAVSPQCKAKLQRLGVPKDKIVVIPNGVDLKLFDSVTQQKVPQQVLYVGRLVNFKHVDWLISAFPEVLRHYPKATLKIVGGGPERPALETRATELGVSASVTFEGVTPTYESVVRYYKESEIFVLPSTVEGEAIVLKEAMAASLPVIAMRVPGSGVLSLVREKGNGILADPSNPVESLRDSILELLSNQEERDSFGYAGKKFVEAHDWAKVAERTLKVYEQELKRRAKSSQ